MIGVGRDEFNGGVYTEFSFGPTFVADTTDQYEQLVRQQFGALAPTVLRLYPVRATRPRHRLSPIARSWPTPSACARPSKLRAAGQGHPVYAYEDDDADSPGETSPAPRCHSAPTTARSTGSPTMRPDRWTPTSARCRTRSWPSGRGSPVPAHRPHPAPRPGRPSPRPATRSCRFRRPGTPRSSPEARSRRSTTASSGTTSTRPRPGRPAQHLPV